MTPYDHIKQDYQNKKVLVFGLGLQGRGVEDAIFFHQLGAAVHVTDKKTSAQLHTSLHRLKHHHLTYTLGEHKPEDVLNADIILRNASVPWEHPLLKLARSKNIPIHMDAELFFHYAKPQAIGITGTRGKSTTTHLIYQILKTDIAQPSSALSKTGITKVILAGNAVSHASLPLLQQHQPQNLYVFELSSWQLQAFHQSKLSPHLAIVTNLYPDHLLDCTYQQYRQDKAAIFLYQQSDDITFFNHDNPDSKPLITQAPAQLATFSANDVPTDWNLSLKGTHNRENIAAAIKVAHHLHIEPELIKQSVMSFQPVPYRLQEIATVNNITIINDTTSTTPIATIKALETYPNSILILGGSTKHLPTEELINSINQQARAVVLLSGTGTDEIKDKINPSLLKGEYSNLRDSLKKALSLSELSRYILFSPAFTSFGMFSNEFDRGEQFNQIVKQLSQSSS